MNRTQIQSGILALFMSCTLLKSRADAGTLTDNFNRADGSVGNGWINASDNSGGDLLIRNGVLTTPGPSGRAGILQVVDTTGSVSASATITSGNGYGGGIYRYDSDFLFGTSGTMNSGYDLGFQRADLTYSDSRVHLEFNGTVLDTIFSPFQFDDHIDVAVTFAPDGSISGTVIGGAGVFNFAFGARSVVFPGSYFGIVMGFPDSRASVITNPTVDNVAVTYGPATPEPASWLLVSAAGGLFGMRRWFRLRNLRR